MSHQTITAWPAQAATATDAPDWRTGQKPWSRPTKLLLLASSAVMLVLAIACAWLSFNAQFGYVRAHNGDQAEQARVWAVLLDTGTVGVSLLRLDETLRMRPGTATRFSLLGCIALSVTMNLLHAPSRSAGGYLVAAVPPVMYATFLEHLLTTLRSLLVPDAKRRSTGRTVALWINFPRAMWSTWRTSLRREANVGRRAQEAGETTDRTPVGLDEVVQSVGAVSQGNGSKAAGRGRRGRGPGVKRLAFEAALTAQVQSGDLRLFSESERVRNEAAYQAAASLPAPLSQGAARRYVVQALPRILDAPPAEKQSASAPVQNVV
jgi:hypothetical protein